MQPLKGPLPQLPSGWCTLGSNHGGRGSGRILPHQWTPLSLWKTYSFHSIVHCRPDACLTVYQISQRAPVLTSLLLTRADPYGGHLTCDRANWHLKGSSAVNWREITKSLFQQDPGMDILLTSDNHKFYRDLNQLLNKEIIFAYKILYQSNYKQYFCNNVWNKNDKKCDKC